MPIYTSYVIIFVYNICVIYIYIYTYFQQVRCLRAFMQTAAHTCALEESLMSSLWESISDRWVRILRLLPHHVDPYHVEQTHIMLNPPNCINSTAYVRVTIDTFYFIKAVHGSSLLQSHNHYPKQHQPPILHNKNLGPFAHKSTIRQVPQSFWCQSF